MIVLGKKKEVAGANLLRPLLINGRGLGANRPDKMPTLSGEEKVICGFDQGLDELLLVCDDLAEMQTLYDKYAVGFAVAIYWYIGDDPGFITVIGPTSPKS